jgi:hypothetical protein
LLIYSKPQADIVWHWEDDFSESQKSKLQSWITQTYLSVESFTAPFPFDTHIYFHKNLNSNEPVPWAHTERDARQGVHFHVNPSYTLNAFKEDWTAPHELSHLLIPYLGKKYRWFAEGFASYMQYQVMTELGVLDEKEMDEKYMKRMSRAEQRFNMDEVSFTNAAAKLFAQKQYPVLYWGGASYFAQVDAKLRKNGTSFQATLQSYLRCCRMRNHDFNRLIQSWDRISDSDIFSTTAEIFKTRPGFPEYLPYIKSASEKE